MTKHKDVINEENVKSLIKNYNLLRIVEKIESRKTTTKIKSEINDNESIFSNSIKSKNFYSEINPQKNQIQTNEINNKSNNIELSKSKSNVTNIVQSNIKTDKLDIKQSKSLESVDISIPCKKHNLPIIAYAIGTNILHCRQCMNESSLKLNPLPVIIKSSKKKIDSIKLKSCLIKHELGRLHEFFDSYQEEFENSNRKKIEDLFDYFNKVVQFNYNTSIQILNQCQSEQKTQINLKIEELNEIEKDLNEINNRIEEYQDLNNKNVLENIEEIDELYEKVMNFINYDSQLSILSMKVGLKNKKEEELFKVFQDLYYIDVEFANINNDLPKINDILQKNIFWSCFCGELNNPVEEVMCISCKCFRKLESIENLYSFPDKVSKENIQILNQRRKLESKLFQENLKENDTSKSFYAIDLEWFLLWKSFVTNDQSEKNLSNYKKNISVNKSIGKIFDNSIGVLSPGPISNNNLFQKDNNFSEATLKKGMIKVSN